LSFAFGYDFLVNEQTTQIRNSQHSGRAELIHIFCNTHPDAIPPSIDLPVSFKYAKRKAKPSQASSKGETETVRWPVSSGKVVGEMTSDQESYATECTVIGSIIYTGIDFPIKVVASIEP